MKTKVLTKTRLLLLAIMVIFITYEAYMHQVKGGGPDGSPSIHALCPYGGLESIYTVFASGSLIDKIYSGTLALFFVSIITALFFRRGFCGWICPLGGLQEFIARLGQKIIGKKLIMPHKVDKFLRDLKYVVLAGTAVLAWKTTTMWMSPYDPWAAYGHLGEGLPAVWKEFSIGFIILMVSFIGSFFYDRFFCKYLCPMGGFLSIISKLSPFKIKRDTDLCINCNLCTKTCPMNIDVAKAEVIDNIECINCQECTSICPKEGALNNTVLFHKSLRIKPLIVGVAIIVLYFGGIGIAKLTNNYILLPQAIASGIEITDVESLKGYMTLSEISTLMAIPLDDVYRKMNIPESIPSTTSVKELGGIIPGFDFHEARYLLESE